MFTVTKQWLRQHASSNGSGYTRDQLSTLGLSWPPPKGWLERIVGSEISDLCKSQFEVRSGKAAFEAEKKRKAAHDAEQRPYYTWPDPTSDIGWRGSWTKPQWWDTGRALQGVRK